MAFLCPNCGSVAYTRSSYYATRHTKPAFVQCTNMLCGGTFETITEFVRWVSKPVDQKPGYMPVSPAPERCQKEGGGGCLFDGQIYPIEPDPGLQVMQPPKTTGLPV